MMPELESLGSIPRALCAVALLWLAAFGLGTLIFRSRQPRSVRLPLRDSHTIDTILLQLVAGLNLLGFCGVVLGQVGWLSNGKSLWLLGGASLLAAPHIWNGLRSGPVFASSFKSIVKREHWPLLLVAALLAVTLGPALCCPTGWDELVYHAELPRRWLMSGHPAFYSDLPYSGFPSLGEILFWLAAPMESVLVPRLMSWTCWCLGLVLLYCLLRRRARRCTSLALTLAFALSEASLMISANCYVETLLLMNIAGLLLALELPVRVSGSCVRRAPPGILGILAGGAAAVKLTGFAVIVVPCLWYVGVAWRNHLQRRHTVQSLIVFVIVALSVSLPFYLRPYLATGNPFYPYFAEWFSNDAVQLDISGYHHTIGGAAFGVRSLPTFLAGPVLLALDTGAYDGTFGWQLLGFLALAAIGICLSPRRMSCLIVWPILVACWFYMFWYLTAQQARFAIPFVLALLLLSAAGLRQLNRRVQLLLLVLMLIATGICIPWRNILYYRGSWQVVAGSLSRTEYIHNLTEFHYVPLIRELHHKLPADAKLMLLFEHRGFYMPRAYVIGTPCFQEQFFSPPERFSEAEPVLALLKENSITHIVITLAPTGPDKAPSWAERQDQVYRSLEKCVQQGRIRIIGKSERYLILEVQ